LELLPESKRGAQGASELKTSGGYALQEYEVKIVQRHPQITDAHVTLSSGPPLWRGGLKTSYALMGPGASAEMDATEIKI